MAHTRVLAKFGLEDYGLKNISFINNKTWAEAEVTPILKLRQALTVKGDCQENKKYK
jgi:hypothetical protein